MNLLPKEIWRDIPGCDGYQASSDGNVRSLGFNGNPEYKNLTTREGRILKPGKNLRGYRQVSVIFHGVRKTVKIAKLVALAFLPNPLGLPEVNHKNECITDDSVTNLEWCTRQYNLHYGTRLERIGKANSKMVAQYTLDGKLVHVWESMQEVNRRLNYRSQNIWQCCKGKRKVAYGYKWEYYNG